MTVTALAALGAACAFAPSWDRYTLHTASGLTRSFTAGNSFANPGPVLAGDMAVMVALVVVAVLAALWRPARLGAALLAGAVIPMAATAVQALVQIGQPLSSAAFGIPPAQAAQAGITISAGVTPAFWIYCVFVLALAMVCAGMLLPSQPSRRAGGYYGPGPAVVRRRWPGSRRRRSAAQPAGERLDGRRDLARRGNHGQVPPGHDDRGRGADAGGHPGRGRPG